MSLNLAGFESNRVSTKYRAQSQVDESVASKPKQESSMHKLLRIISCCTDPKQKKSEALIESNRVSIKFKGNKFNIAELKQFQTIHCSNLQI